MSDETIKEWATKEANNSQLPGRENGPADAYRHLLGAAEFTRVYGKKGMQTAGFFNDDLMKRFGSNDQKNGISYDMDSFNNRVAILIGERSHSREDVIRYAREAIDKGFILKDNEFQSVDKVPRNQAIWLEEKHWIKNPMNRNSLQEERLPTSKTNFPPIWPKDGKECPSEPSWWLSERVDSVSQELQAIKQKEKTQQIKEKNLQENGKDPRFSTERKFSDFATKNFSVNGQPKFDNDWRGSLDNMSEERFNQFNHRDDFKNEQDIEKYIEHSLELRKEIHKHQFGKNSNAYKQAVTQDEQRMTGILETRDAPTLNRAVHMIANEYEATFGKKAPTYDENAKAPKEQNLAVADAKAPIETAALTTPASVQPLAASAGGQSRSSSSPQNDGQANALKALREPTAEQAELIKNLSPQALALMQALAADQNKLLNLEEKATQEKAEKIKLIQANRVKGLPDDTPASPNPEVASKENAKDASKTDDKSSPRQAKNDPTINGGGKEAGAQNATQVAANNTSNNADNPNAAFDRALAKGQEATQRDQLENPQQGRALKLS